YVPLDPSYPAKRLAFMFEDTAVPVLVTEARFLEVLPAANVRTICVDRDRAALDAEASAPLGRTAGPDDLAYVTYTSGSTGVPKGVEVRHRGVLRLLFGVEYVHLGADERILQLAPVAFDASTFEVWGALLHGGCSVVFPEGVPTSHDLGDVIARPPL